jgi:hypothetical protein
MPNWADGLISLYRGMRGSVLEMTIHKDIPENYADLAVAGVSLVTMISRKVLGFAFSIGGFAVLAAIAWFVLSKMH